jgi:hypothetical protein
VGDAVRGAVGVAVRGAVDGAVGVAVHVAVRGAVGVAVRGAVGGDNALAFARALWSRLWSNVIGGQFWVGEWWWHGSPSMATFFVDVCGLELAPHILAAARANVEQAQSACWWWPHRDFVMVCERPVRMARDARGRLHCEDKAAVEWPDGWGVYSWHGVRVPAWLISHPERVTPALIDQEKNQEVRRAMVERYGADRYLQNGGSVLVHKDAFGELYRKDVAGDEPLMLVKVKNSTPESDGSIKSYWLRVHPELRPLRANGELGDPQKLTAHNAVASTFGLRGEEYQPQVET